MFKATMAAYTAAEVSLMPDVNLGTPSSWSTPTPETGKGRRFTLFY